MQSESIGIVQFDPLVSVITVVRNGRSSIRSCIESVLAQTYPKIEHIVVDGVSNDGTIDILKGYGQKIGPWISEPDTGIYNALNKGIRLARGKYYIPLGCDDILLPNAASDLVKSIGQNAVAMGKVICMSPSGLELFIQNHSAGSLISIDAHARFGMYDETFRIAADTKFLEIIKKSNLVKYVDIVVGKFVLGGASSNYSLTIREHSRAMYEAGCWTKLKSVSWLFPRLIYSKFKS